MTEETTYRFPIRYYSITTVGKDFITEEQETTPKRQWGTVVNSLTPYLFLLYETENGKPYWQYLDLAGNLDKITYTDEKSHAEVKKITYPNGAYMYQAEKIYLQRK